MAQTFTMGDLKQRLQARQHKMTPQRQTVLQVFLDHPGTHLSAEDVHDILRQNKSEIGLATVYRSRNCCRIWASCRRWSSVTAAAAMRSIRRIRQNIIIII